MISTTAMATGPTFGHVEKRGSGERVLILVPCLGCDWSSWDEFMDRNSSRYTMFAVTWPGLGDTPLPDCSDRSGDMRLHDYLDDALAALIKKENLEQPTIIGHSAAGPSVLRFAYRFPDLVGKIISADAVITNWDTYGYTKAQRDAWADKEMEDVYKNYDNDEAWKKLNTAKPRSYGDREDRAAFYTKMWQSPPRKNVFAYWHEWLKNDVGAIIHKIEHPFLAVYAISARSKDPGKKRADTLKRFERAKVGKNVEVTFIESASHTIWETQPAAFDKAIADFVSRSSR